MICALTRRLLASASARAAWAIALGCRLPWPPSGGDAGCMRSAPRTVADLAGIAGRTPSLACRQPKRPAASCTCHHQLEPSKRRRGPAHPTAGPRSRGMRSARRGQTGRRRGRRKLSRVSPASGCSRGGQRPVSIWTRPMRFSTAVVSADPERSARNQDRRDGWCAAAETEERRSPPCAAPYRMAMCCQYLTKAPTGKLVDDHPSRYTLHGDPPPRAIAPASSSPASSPASTNARAPQSGAGARCSASALPANPHDRRGVARQQQLHDVSAQEAVVLGVERRPWCLPPIFEFGEASRSSDRAAARARRRRSRRHVSVIVSDSVLSQRTSHVRRDAEAIERHCSWALEGVIARASERPVHDRARRRADLSRDTGASRSLRQWGARTAPGKSPALLALHQLCS